MKMLLNKVRFNPMHSGFFIEIENLDKLINDEKVANAYRKSEQNAIRKE